MTEASEEVPPPFVKKISASRLVHQQLYRYPKAVNATMARASLFS